MISKLSQKILTAVSLGVIGATTGCLDSEHELHPGQSDSQLSSSVSGQPGQSRVPGISVPANGAPGASGSSSSGSAATADPAMAQDLKAGQTLYQTNCASCHGAIAVSSKAKRSETQINGAISSVGLMASMKSLAGLDVARIALALGGESSLSRAPASTGGTGSSTAGNGTMPPAMSTPPPTSAPPTAPPLTNLTCDAPGVPMAYPLQRLSRTQYLNSFIEGIRLGGLLYYYSHPNEHPYDGPMEPLTNLVPIDNNKPGFDRMDQTITPQHLDAYFFMANGISDGLLNDPQQVVNLVGSCYTDTNNEPCLRNFLSRLGRRLFRRPLTAAEVDRYFTIMKNNGSNTVENIALITRVLLMSPQFLLRIEIDGTPVAGSPDVLELTPYEKMARITLAFQERAPIDYELDDAANGRISTAAGYKSYIDALVDARNSGSVFYYALTPVQNTYRNFYSQWLKFDKVPTFTNSPTFDKFATGTYINESHHDHRQNAINEIDEFMYRQTWEKKGTYRDLMMDPTGYIESFDLGNLYGLGMVYGDPGGVRTLGPDRAGLLTRAAFLFSGNEKSNPILRGVFIRRQILCDELPSPDLNNLPDRVLEEPAFDPTQTTRDRYAHKTSPDTCMACHSQINSLGFALEGFDSLGRSRSKESVFGITSYNSDGSANVSLLGTPAVNTSVTTLNINAPDSTPASNAVDLSRQIADSGKGAACFARQFFRYTYNRKESVGDGCAVSNMAKAMTNPGGSLSEVVRSSVMQPDFQRKRLASP